jgi:hypothetical protein
MTTGLKKLLESQLGSHFRVHANQRELRPVRIAHSLKTSPKSSSRALNVTHMVTKLELYTTSCGAILRNGIRDFKPAGMIVLLQSASGQAFHVELNASDKELAITRVSAGGTAKNVQKAILRVGKALATRKSKSELRVFRVTAMHLSAIWGHHSKDDSADVFVPYTPNFAGLTLGRSYKPQRFASILKKHATHMILRWYGRYENGFIQGGKLAR